jgi:hypothetical protein
MTSVSYCRMISWPDVAAGGVVVQLGILPAAVAHDGKLWSFLGVSLRWRSRIEEDWVRPGEQAAETDRRAAQRLITSARSVVEASRSRLRDGWRSLLRLS